MKNLKQNNLVNMKSADARLILYIAQYFPFEIFSPLGSFQGLPMSSISDGTKRGDFCFHADKVGDVDDHIRAVPINVNCDPRITCGLSVSSNCIKQPGMKDITVRRSLSCVIAAL